MIWSVAERTVVIAGTRGESGDDGLRVHDEMWLQTQGRGDAVVRMLAAAAAVAAGIVEAQDEIELRETLEKALERIACIREIVQKTRR